MEMKTLLQISNRIFLMLMLSFDAHNSNIWTKAMSIEKAIVDSAKMAEMFDFFHVMPEGDVQVMAEWDLLLTMDQYEFLHTERKRTKRKAFKETDVNKKWPACIVYYEIHESLDTGRDVNIIKEAMKEWEKYTCLVFKENHQRQQRIIFKDGTGCYSSLGMQNKPQPLALANGCRTKWIIAHEIGHAIGWIHEHMRPDRDEYVHINFDVIEKSSHKDYAKYSPDAIETYGVQYDYTSLMHYGNAVYRNSILALDPRYQEKLGQRQGFSFNDIKHANLMYDCSSMCPNKLDCSEGGGFQLLNNLKGKGKCQCWCDSGDIFDPLVLCSERTIVPPPPEPSVKPTDMPKKSCMDVREEDCAQRKQLGHCMTHMSIMSKVCAKTCNFCDKDTCMDKDKGCAIMAATGICTKPGMQNTMSDICMASCDLCPKRPSPCDIQKDMMGESSVSSPSADDDNAGHRNSMSIGVAILNLIYISTFLTLFR